MGISERNKNRAISFLAKGKVYVWGLRIYTGIEIENEFEIVKIPRRFWVQAGLFTRLHKYDFYDAEFYLKSRGIAHYLDCYEIPLSSTAATLSDFKFNISSIQYEIIKQTIND